jgi:TonB family protein
MKNQLLCLLVWFQLCPAHSQTYRFEYEGRQTPSLKKQKLDDAIFISEIMPDFFRFAFLSNRERTTLEQQLKATETPIGNYIYPPDNYVYQQKNYDRIIDYVSVQVTANCNGKLVTAQSAGNILTVEQKYILGKVDLGSDVEVKIKFKYKYPAADHPEIDSRLTECSYSVTAVPETEAMYPGGKEEMTSFLQGNIFNKISTIHAAERIGQAVVKFTVNENGKVMNARIARSSADPIIDKLILDAIRKMPVWKPAKNQKGLNVRQEFSIPFGGGC